MGTEFRVETYLSNYNFSFDNTMYVIFINVCGSKEKSFPDKQ